MPEPVGRPGPAPLEYEIVGEPRAEAYGKLIRQLARTADSASLVMRDELAFGVEAGDLVTELIGHGGSASNDDEALRITFPLNAMTARLLTDAATALFDWASPSLPEDLSVYDRDGEVLMQSTSAERSAVLKLTDAARERLHLECPGLGLRLRATPAAAPAG